MDTKGTEKEDKRGYPCCRSNRYLCPVEQRVQTEPRPGTATRLEEPCHAHPANLSRHRPRWFLDQPRRDGAWIWSIYFRDVSLGRYHEEERKVLSVRPGSYEPVSRSQGHQRKQRRRQLVAGAVAEELAGGGARVLTKAVCRQGPSSAGVRGPAPSRRCPRSCGGPGCVRVNAVDWLSSGTAATPSRRKGMNAARFSRARSAKTRANASA